MVTAIVTMGEAAVLRPGITDQDPPAVLFRRAPALP
ncbi:MAG: hypothetical protein K0S39_1889, partial [Paenibacillus sp.]|nr:hypothetical protein [Paenibacillus sp.]